MQLFQLLSVAQKPPLPPETHVAALHDEPQPLLSRSSISWPQHWAQDEVRETGLLRPSNVFPSGSKHSFTILQFGPEYSNRFGSSYVGMKACRVGAHPVLRAGIV